MPFLDGITSLECSLDDVFLNLAHDPTGL